MLIEMEPASELVLGIERTDLIVEPTVEIEYITAGPQGPPGQQGLKGEDGYIGADGAPGPVGPAGPAGGTYSHVQGVAAEVWTVTHNLGFEPNVTVIDSASATVEGDVTYLSMNQLTIGFAASFSGRATLT